MMGDKRLAPTEINRKEAMFLARAHLGSRWRTTTWQDAWDLIGMLSERGAAPDAVAGWYRRASAQLAAGDRCQQWLCFGEDWRTWTRTGTCPRLSLP